MEPADRETFAAIADLLRSVRRDSRGRLLDRNILVFNENGLRAAGRGLRAERS